MLSADRPNLLRCWMSCREWEAAGLIEVEPDLRLRMQSTVEYMACRTAFFDELFLEVTGAGRAAGGDLAVGLDSRAWRLPWPDGTTVYELDQPKLLECLRCGNAARSPPRIWPTALQQAGFDISAPRHLRDRRDRAR